MQNDWEHQIGIGRPFQQFYVALRGAIVAPWLIGMLGTLFLALANWQIVKLLHITNRLYILAVCAALTTNATITLVNATYLDWFDIMMLALFLSCASINLCNRHTWYCSAALLLCLSAGLYQSYLSAAVTLTLISCAQRLLANQRKECLHFGIRVAFTIIAGLLLYLVAQKVAFVLAGGAEYHTYNSVSAAFSSNTPIYQVAFAVWLDFWTKLVWPETYAIPLIGVCNLALLTIGLIGLLGHARNNTSKTNLLLAATILALLPLAMNCVNIASYPTVHSLMIFSYYLFYPAVFAILQSCSPSAASISTANSPSTQPQPNKSKTGHRASRHFAPIVLSTTLVLCMAASGVIYANQVYLKKDLEYQATFSFMTRLVERMDTTDGYVPGETPVAFVGVPSNNVLFKNNRIGFPPALSQPTFDDSGQFTGYAVGLAANIPISSVETVELYFHNILGLPLKIADTSSMSQAEREAGIDSVPEAFPSQKSIDLIDGTLFVRVA